MAEDSSYRSGVYRKRGGNEFIVGSTGTFESYGSNTFATGAKFINSNVVSATANTTLAVGDSGITVLAGAADLRINLPAASDAGKGWEATVILASGGLSTGTGIKIKPDSSDKIMGNDLSAADGKRLTLLGATDTLGDFARLKCDGDQGFYIVGSNGGWTLTTVT